MHSPTRKRSTGAALTPLLRVEELCVGFGERTILHGVTFDIGPTGITGILGPAGVGKSTLLRTIGRWNEASPGFWTTGGVSLDDVDLLCGLPLEPARRQVALLAQKARLYTASILDNAIALVRPERPLSIRQKRELARQVLSRHGLLELLGERLDEPVTNLSLGQQRVLSLARLCSGGARCLLADEPLRDLSEEDRALVRRFLLRLAVQRAIVMVTHDQRLAREVCANVCLMTAGRIVEQGEGRRFFEAPRTELGRVFVKTGNCWPTEAEPSRGPGPEQALFEVASSRDPVPRGFHWVIRKLLAGAQWPGLLDDVHQDLRGLRSLGIRVVVSLTEQPFSASRLKEYGITSIHFPIEDMGVPALGEALKLCDVVSAKLARGVPVVLHCKAGLGRTGTMLACVLVHRGVEPVRAIHEVRLVNPHYIQSERQLTFISEFGEFLARSNDHSRSQ